MIVGAVVSFTVRVVVQLVVLPAASATVSVMVVLPSAATEPAAGDCVVEVTAQLSAETTLAVKSGTRAVQLAPAETVWLEAQVVMVGAVTSMTVKVVVHVVVLPAASATVSVIVLAPRTPAEPAAGDWVTEAMPQLSLATTPAVKFGTAAEQLLSALALWAAGHEVMTGAVVSWTVIVTVQVEELPAASVAVRVTGKLPTVTGVPAGNDWVTTGVLQLSVTEALPVMSGKTAAQNSFTDTVLAGAQLAKTGGVVSETVKVVVQVTVLPAAS